MLPFVKASVYNLLYNHLAAYLISNSLELVLIDHENYEAMQTTNKLIYFPNPDPFDDGYTGTCNPKIVMPMMEGVALGHLSGKNAIGFFLVRAEGKQNKRQYPVVSIVLTFASNVVTIEMVCSLSKYENDYSNVENTNYADGDLPTHEPMFPQATSRLFVRILETCFEYGATMIVLESARTAKTFYMRFGFKVYDDLWMSLTQRDFQSARDNQMHGGKGSMKNYVNTHAHTHVLGHGRRVVYSKGKSMFVTVNGRWMKLS